MRRFFDAGRLHIETEEHKLDGTPIWIEGNYICFYDTDGMVIGNFGIQRDITQRKRADQALKRYTKRLEAMQGQNRAILAATQQRP